MIDFTDNQLTDLILHVTRQNTSYCVNAQRTIVCACIKYAAGDTLTAADNHNLDIAWKSFMQK